GLGVPLRAPRALVQPMDEAGPLAADNARQPARPFRAEMVQERVHQRPAPVPWRRMRHETRRLVEDQQVSVLEQNLQGDRLAGDLERRWLRDVPLDRIARLDLERGFGRSPVDCDGALPDQTLDGGAGEASGVGAEENVKALRGLAPGDGHAAGHLRMDL